MHVYTFALSASLPGLAAAWAAPDISGFNLVFQDDFLGSAGSAPNATNWHTITNSKPPPFFSSVG